MITAETSIRAPAAIEPAKGIFIDNRWHPSGSGRAIDVYAPAEGAVLAQIAAGNVQDVSEAVAAARRAFEAGAW